MSTHITGTGRGPRAVSSGPAMVATMAVVVLFSGIVQGYLTVPR
ncbi:hypothetical protein OG698_13710 [Streptomyces sp. NBC_01003]|nr:hypothetical protein OG698_13710 [Streptomyces sp. NBC_01003]